jgi:uncharacterized protein with von Willebrand factor type A (vWA) domain
MGHDAPWPERSTGQMVKGSDLDLVVITDDAVPEDFIRRLDDAIYQQKYRISSILLSEKRSTTLSNRSPG